MKMFRVVVNDHEYKVGIEELAEEASGAFSPTTVTPHPVQSQPTAKAQPKTTDIAKAKTELAATNGSIIAPMPGTVLQITVNTGDKITKGQTLLVLEAMKMENEIMAPTSGVIQEIRVSKGASVNAGDILIIWSS